MGLDLIILATVIPAIIVIGAMLSRNRHDKNKDDDGSSPGSHLG